jgi:DNA-binding beta-propeller fold protein YncE
MLLAPLLLALVAPAQEGLPAPIGRLVVLNKAEASASLLDLTTGAERARLPVGVGPHEVAVAPDGRLAVVANYGTQAAGSSLTAIDLEAEAPIRTIDLGAAARPHGILYDPDGAHVWVTAEQRGALLRVRVADGATVAEVPTPQPVGHMVARGDAGFLYVSHIGGGGVTPVRPADDGWKAGAFVPTGEGAEGLCTVPDGTLWVGNRAADTLTVLDGASLKPLVTLAAGGFPIRATTTPDGFTVLVSCANAGVLRFYHARQRIEMGAPLDFRAQARAQRADGRLTEDLRAEPAPIGTVVPPRSSYAYVALTQADRVAEVDLPTRTVTRWLRAGREPDGLAWYAAGGR